jgi:hypothetical protein
MRSAQFQRTERGDADRRQRSAGGHLLLEEHKHLSQRLDRLTGRDRGLRHNVIRTGPDQADDFRAAGLNRS